jgi:hypothetical protein
LSVSVGYAEAVTAGDARLGTGTDNGGSEMFTLCPAALPPGIAALATTAVFNAEIAAVLAAVLRNTRTVLVVVDDSVIRTDSESITAPSFELQSTSNAHPAPLGVLKLEAVVSPAVLPIVANECNGRSTSRGILFELDVANRYPRGVSQTSRSALQSNDANQAGFGMLRCGPLPSETPVDIPKGAAGSDIVGAAGVCFIAPSIWLRRLSMKP